MTQQSPVIWNQSQVAGYGRHPLMTWDISSLPLPLRCLSQRVGGIRCSSEAFRVEREHAAK
jgi:hypothetical protein